MGTAWSLDQQLGRDMVESRGTNMLKSIALMAATVSVAGCAANQAALLIQSPLMVLHSTKLAGQVAGCASQRLNGGPSMGTDGTNFWVTQSRNLDCVRGMS